MRRREILRSIGVAVAAWPLVARAQNPSKVYRIGLLSSTAPISEKSPLGAALIRDLSELGYQPTKNFVFESRGAEGHLERLPQLVAELVLSKADIIVTGGYPAARAAKQGTTLPVVTNNSGDPVGTGLAESLAHPGGNVTGISDVSAEVTPKRLQLLKEFAPDLQRVAVLWNADDLGMTLRYRAAESAAEALGVSIQALGVREPDDFGDAFVRMAKEMPGGILMVTDSLTTLNRKRVFEFATANRLPAMYEFDFLVK